MGTAPTASLGRSARLWILSVAAAAFFVGYRTGLGRAVGAAAAPSSVERTDGASPTVRIALTAPEGPVSAERAPEEPEPYLGPSTKSMLGTEPPHGAFRGRDSARRARDGQAAGR